MTKMDLCSVADEEFAYFLNKIDGVLNDEKIPYIFVGGAANQLHIVRALCDKYKTDIATLAKNDSIRLQDFIRATDDIDLAITPDVYTNAGSDETVYFKSIVKILNKLGDGEEHISPSGEHLLQYNITRQGSKRPLFRVINDGKINEEEQIMLNISRSPKDLEDVAQSNYQRFLDARERIVVPYNNDFSINASVIAAPYLMGMKVAKFRPKDIMDLTSLEHALRENGTSLDWRKFFEVLDSEHIENYQKFIGLIRQSPPTELIPNYFKNLEK